MVRFYYSFGFILLFKLCCLPPPPLPTQTVKNGVKIRDDRVDSRNTLEKVAEDYAGHFTDDGWMKSRVIKSRIID